MTPFSSRAVGWTERALRDAACLEQRGRPHRAGIELLGDRDEGAIRRRRHQDRDARRRLSGEALGGEADAGPRGAVGSGISRVLQEGQVGRSGAVERRDAADAAVGRDARTRDGAGQGGNLLRGQPVRTLEEQRLAHPAFIGGEGAERNRGCVGPGNRDPGLDRAFARPGGRIARLYPLPGRREHGLAAVRILAAEARRDAAAIGRMDRHGLDQPRETVVRSGNPAQSRRRALEHRQQVVAGLIGERHVAGRAGRPVRARVARHALDRRAVGERLCHTGRVEIDRRNAELIERLHLAGP